MAYTLNNGQPVRCTLLGEEPLFYMDYEGSFDDDLEFEAAFDFDTIEKGIDRLRDRLVALERPADEGRAAAAMAAYRDDLFLATGADAAAAEFSLAGLEDVLRRSRLAAAYLDFAARFGCEIRPCAQTPDAFYDRESGHIHINPRLGRDAQILMAARELRRQWQHRNGALVHPLSFHPDQAILVNRAQVADLAASMVRIAWELQLAGEKDAWERIEFSPMADLARAFARESYLDFRTLNNGTAAGAVFEAWFLSDRCRHEDRRLIQQMLADYSGYVFDKNDVSRTITADLIVALGTVPFGKNYLAPYVQTIMGDPVFTDVRDRSNANFLWFIKFERSFRETEQELQNASTVKDPGDRQGAASKEKQRRTGKPDATENVISLPRGDGIPSIQGSRRRAGGAEIITFRVPSE